MAAGFGQNVRDLLGRASSDIRGCVSVHYEGQGTNRPLIGFDADPARDAVLRFHGELTPEQLAELRPKVLLWKPVENALALPASVERHHETRLILGGPMAYDAKAERAMPPSRRAPAGLDVLDLRLPDQRAIGKEPCVLAWGMGRHRGLHGGVIVLVGLVTETWLLASILADCSITQIGVAYLTRLTHIRHGSHGDSDG